MPTWPPPATASRLLLLSMSLLSLSRGSARDRLPGAPLDDDAGAFLATSVAGATLAQAWRPTAAPWPSPSPRDGCSNRSGDSSEVALLPASGAATVTVSLGRRRAAAAVATAARRARSASDSSAEHLAAAGAVAAASEAAAWLRSYSSSSHSAPESPESPWMVARISSIRRTLEPLDLQHRKTSWAHQSLRNPPFDRYL